MVTHSSSRPPRRGASAVCVEDYQPVSIPQLRVADTRAALAASGRPPCTATLRRISAWWESPGTNGKTTVAHMLESITRAAGLPSGLIGTIGARSGDRPLRIGRTTPESTDLQRMLADMVSDQVRRRRHGSVLPCPGSWSGWRPPASRSGAFTNLSQDHLDFHSDMESYFAAKARCSTKPGKGGHQHRLRRGAPPRRHGKRSCHHRRGDGETFGRPKSSPL